MARGDNTKEGKNKPLYNCTKEHLKKMLIFYSVDAKGKKVSKNKLSKNWRFIKSINYTDKKIVKDNIQNWYYRLENIHPYGVINDRFLFEYHKKVTKKIKKNKTFEEWKNENKNILPTKKEDKLYSRVEKLKRQIGWDDRVLYLSILSFAIKDLDKKQYSKVSVEDLKELIDIYFSYEEFIEKVEYFDELILNGDEKLVEYLL